MWYTAKEDADNPDARSMYGLIVEEVAEVDPTLVYWVPDEANPGAERPESVHYIQLGPLAIKALQGQRDRIVQLEAQAAAMEARAAAAEAKAAALEARTVALETEMQGLRAMVAALASQPAARV